MPKTQSHPRKLKPDALRLRRRLVVHMTEHEYERLRQAASCESVAAYVRGLIRQSANGANGSTQGSSSETLGNRA
jgi:hypothetical protein